MSVSDLGFRSCGMDRAGEDLHYSAARKPLSYIPRLSGAFGGVGGLRAAGMR